MGYKTGVVDFLIIGLIEIIVTLKWVNVSYI